MKLFSKLFSRSTNNATVVDIPVAEVFNVQEIHEKIQLDPMYRAATTQPSIFLNGNYVGNVTVFSFLGTNWTVTTLDGIVSIQTTGGGGGGSFVVKKDGTVIVASTTNLNFTGTAISVVQDLTNPNQANISVVNGGITSISSTTLTVGGTTANTTIDVPSGKTLVIPNTPTSGRALSSIDSDGNQLETNVINTINGLFGITTIVGAGDTTVNTNADGTITITSTGGGGGNTASFSYTPQSGQVPLVVNFTDLTNPVPTSWAWTVAGSNVVATDYSFTNGTTPTSQNPQITFNTVKTFTVTLTPAKTGIVYNAFTVAITPTPATVIVGDFTVANAFFGIPSGVLTKPFYNYSGSDGFSVTVNKINAQTCQSVTSATVISSNGSPAPVIVISPSDINNGNTVNSDNILLPNFPVNYKINVDAIMNNSDGTTTDQFRTSNTVNYYIPALYIQNQLLTAPTFAIPYQQVKLTDYVAGQSLAFVAGSDIQVVWVAFPKTFTTPPNAYIVVQGQAGSITRVSDTAIIQTISGQAYSIYGFQLSSTGGSVYPALLYLETSPVTQYLEPESFSTSETPKLGFFKRLFGAKS